MAGGMLGMENFQYRGLGKEVDSKDSKDAKEVWGCQAASGDGLKNWGS